MDITEAFKIIKNFAFLPEEELLIEGLKIRLNVYSRDKSTFNTPLISLENVIKESIFQIVSLRKSNESLMKLIYSEDDFKSYDEAIEFIKDYLESIKLMKKLL